MLFNDEERKRISAAIATAERNTSGEIVAVVAGASDTYAYVPYLIAALVALIFPWPFIHFTWWSVQTIYLLQLDVFFAILVLLWPTAVRIKFVPRRILERNAERRAAEQFLAQNLHTTRNRTGALLFISELERHAVICADSKINMHVEPGTWQKIIDALTSEIGTGQAAQGFVHAIENIGEILAKHFPPHSNEDNEHPNHLIVLDD